jgi:hypothetical protein
MTIMKKGNFVLICLFLGIISINMWSGSDTSQISISTSLVSMNTAFANYGEGGGGTNYIKTQWDTDVQTTSSSTSVGCPSGQKKNCITTTGNRHTSCMSGGHEACTAGVVAFSDKVCGNCS